MTDIPRNNLVKRLRKAATEIRAENINGWGNSCDEAADRIEALEAHLDKLSETMIAWANSARAVYDPPVITSEPGAPHDGRAQPKADREYLDEANYYDKDYLTAWRGE